MKDPFSPSNSQNRILLNSRQSAGSDPPFAAGGASLGKGCEVKPQSGTNEATTDQPSDRRDVLPLTVDDDDAGSSCVLS